MNKTGNFNIKCRQTLLGIISYLTAKCHFIAIIYCAVFGSLWIVFWARGYYFFTYTSGWDLAFFAQALWGILHGDLFLSLYGANFLALHTNFFLVLLSPVYALFSEAVFLQYIKIFSFFFSAYIFFLILKKKFHPLIALGAMVVFTLAPANIGLLKCLFNDEVFAIPLILIIFKAIIEKKYIIFVVFCFLLSMVKEQMPLIVMMLGVVMFFIRKDEKVKWALVPFVMGLSIFILEIFVFLPYLRKDLTIKSSFFIMRYSQYGNSFSEVAGFLITYPLKIFNDLISPDNIRWFNDLFGVLGGLAFLSPFILIPVLPAALKVMLSNYSLEHDIFTYYSAIFTPFVYLAVWNTLDYIKGPKRIYVHSLALCVMLITVLAYTPRWWNDLIAEPVWTTNSTALRKFIDQIPNNASVVAGPTTLPHLANRKHIYMLGDYLFGPNIERTIKYPKEIDYLILNTQEFPADKDIPVLSKLIFDERWSLQESIEDVFLFSKSMPDRKSLRPIERGDQPFLEGLAQSLSFDNVIQLDGVELNPKLSKNKQMLPVTFFWKSIAPTNVFYELSMKIMTNGQVVYTKQRRIGLNLYPSKYWRSNEYVKETYFYLLPQLDSGKYLIEFEVYNPNTKEFFKNKRQVVIEKL